MIRDALRGRLWRRGVNVVTENAGVLSGEFVVDGLDEFVEVEWFFEDAAGAEEFCDIEEVTVALGAGHGNHLRVEIFPRQLQSGFQAVGSRHQDIHQDQVDLVLLVEGDAFLSIASLEHTVVGSFENLLQEASDRFFVVDNKDGSHSARCSKDIFDLTYVGFLCLGEMDSMRND